MQLLNLDSHRSPTVAEQLCRFCRYYSFPWTRKPREGKGRNITGRKRAVRLGNGRSGYPPRSRQRMTRLDPLLRIALESRCFFEERESSRVEVKILCYVLSNGYFFIRFWKKKKSMLRINTEIVSWTRLITLLRRVTTYSHFWLNISSTNESRDKSCGKEVSK